MDYVIALKNIYVIIRLFRKIIRKNKLHREISKAHWGHNNPWQRNLAPTMVPSTSWIYNIYNIVVTVIIFKIKIFRIYLWIGMITWDERASLLLLRAEQSMPITSNPTVVIILEFSVVRVGPGHRPRFNSCLSFSMARSAILEFIFPRCYFPCVPGSIVCSLTQSIYFLSYLVFSNQIFQYPLLIVKGGRLVS